MMIVQRYLMGEIVRTFALSLLVLTSIFLLAVLYELLHQGLPLRLVGSIVPFAVGATAPFLLPVALGIGCALAYGRLAADNEYLPIVHGAIHPCTVVAPGLVIGLAMSFVMYGAQSTLIPYCYLRKKNVMLKILEDLVALPRSTNVALKDERKGFFFFAEGTDGERIRGVSIAGWPEAFGSIGGSEPSKDGRIEVVAEHGRIHRGPNDDVLIDLEGATISYLTATRPDFERLRRQSGGVLRVDEEATRLRVERQGVPLLQFTRADRDRDGAIDAAEWTSMWNGLDRTENPVSSVHEAHFRRISISLPSESKTRFRMGFRTTRELARYARDVASFRNWLDGPGPLHARTPLLSLQLAAVGIPGAGPVVPATLTGVLATSPGPIATRVLLRLERATSAEVHQRAVLSCVPFLFAWVASTIPLLVRSNNRLVPFFAAFVILCVVFFLPFVVADSLIDKGRGSVHPAAALWMPPLLSSAVAAALTWRLFRW